MSNDLANRVWEWQGTQAGSTAATPPAQPERYTIAFDAGGRLRVRLDCNRGSGAYEIDGDRLRFGPIASTKMGCPPDSRDAEFARQLADVAGYELRDGSLALSLRGGGTMRFRAVP